MLELMLASGLVSPWPPKAECFNDNTLQGQSFLWTTEYLWTANAGHHQLVDIQDDDSHVLDWLAQAI